MTDKTNDTQYKSISDDEALLIYDERLFHETENKMHTEVIRTSKLTINSNMSISF